MRLSQDSTQLNQPIPKTGITMKVNLQQKEDEKHYRGRLLTGTVHNAFILMSLNEQRFRTHTLSNIFPLYLVLSKLVLGTLRLAWVFISKSK